jgi:hypothetical protein
MKKFVFSVIVSGLCATAAIADMSISWLGPSGGVTDDGGAPAPAGWVTQLIWAPGMSAGPLNIATPFALPAGEVLLNEQTLNGNGINGRILGDFGGLVAAAYNAGTNPTSASLDGGYVYARVFNVTSTGDRPTFYGTSTPSGAPAGTALVDGPATNTETLATARPVVAVNMAIAAIPEPSTYALMAFGGVVAFWRTRRKK